MAAVAVKIGVDAHKSTHTLVVADELGRQLATKTVTATSEGHLTALHWARRWPQRSFALEDCRHLTRRLEGDLLRAGEVVERVPTVLMAGARRGGRERGKFRAAARSRPARSSARRPGPTASTLRQPSPGGTERRPSRCGAATRSASASTEAGTDR